MNPQSVSKKLKFPLITLIFILATACIVQATYPPDLFFGDLPAPYSYVVKTDGSLYWTVRYDGAISSSSASAQTIQQACVNALTSGGTIYLQEVQLSGSVTYGANIIFIESYQGRLKVYSTQGKGVLLSQLGSDPSTAGWGVTQRGFWWYNTVDNRIKYWDGTQVQVLPSILGASNQTSLILAPTYTVYQNVAGTIYYAMDMNGTIFSDSTPDIGALFNTVNAGIKGQYWFIRSGNYYVHTALQVPACTKIEGASDAGMSSLVGWGTEFYIHSGHLGISIIQNYDNEQHSSKNYTFGITIRDIAFRGRLDSVSDPANHASDAGKAIDGAFQECTFDNIYMQDFNIGIDVWNRTDSGAWGQAILWDNELLNVQGKHFYTSGISLGQYSGDTIILGGHLQMAGGNYTNDANIHNDYNATYGCIWIHAAADVHIQSIILDMSSYGIYCDNGGSVFVSDISIDQIRRHGIYLEGVSNVIITGNRIMKCGWGRNDTYCGIFLANGTASDVCWNIDISHNIFKRDLSASDYNCANAIDCNDNDGVNYVSITSNMFNNCTGLFNGYYPLWKVGDGASVGTELSGAATLINEHNLGT